MCMEFALLIHTPKSKSTIDFDDLMTFPTTPPVRQVFDLQMRKSPYLRDVNTTFVAPINAPKRFKPDMIRFLLTRLNMHIYLLVVGVRVTSLSLTFNKSYFFTCPQ